MKTIFLFVLSCVFVFAACSQDDTACGQQPAISYINIPAGQSTITLRQFRFDVASPFLLLHLHSNELSAAEAANAVSCQWGIEFLQISNNGGRMIPFLHQGQWTRFDPNRIFSEEGIRKTLQQNGVVSDLGLSEVKRFSDSLLLHLNRYQTIVAVHNNTDGRFNIRQYLQIDAERVHINERQDEDDFFITNDADFFAALKAENFNVVWEDATQMEEDGSLSLYCSRHAIRYINVEAQHGHTFEQINMLKAVTQIITQEKKR